MITTAVFSHFLLYPASMDEGEKGRRGGGEEGRR
jgi:hypothetical protein